MAKKQAEAEAALHDQTQLLPKRDLLVVFGIMSLALLVCFIDQNSIGVLQPVIARDLNAQSSISWTGTSALIANTTFQVLYGRLSDLFGRKNIMLSALVLLSLSDLACGLSVSSTTLYIFRGLAGVAGGGITSLSMMIVSDVVTLQERGKYQGILGVQVGLGNALGPLLASAFAVNGTWRGIFYLLAPLTMLAAAASWKWLPTNMPKLNVKETIAKIDVLGLLTGTAAVISLLIPTSEGGHTGTPWNSPMEIAMFTVGGVCLIAFLLIEWKWASLPMMPLGMFKKPSVAAMLAQTFLLGACYYTYLFFLTLYLQNVRGTSPLIAAALQLPLNIVQSAVSTLAGYYQSRYNRYIEIIWFGFGIWTLGAGVLVLCDENLSLGLFCFFLVIIGTGTGCVFQPTLVALQAHCSKAERAVVTSNRNFLRSSGAAVGLAISSAILSNVLKSALPSRLEDIAQDAFAVPNLSGYSSSDQQVIKAAYSAASRAVFIWCVPLVGLCFLLCAFVEDKGLVRKEERDTPDQVAEEGKTSSPSPGDVVEVPLISSPSESGPDEKSDVRSVTSMQQSEKSRKSTQSGSTVNTRT